MEALRVLHGEVVKPEPLLHESQLGRVGLDHSEPHESSVAVEADPRGLVELHRSLVLAPAVAVVSTVDDHASSRWLARVRTPNHAPPTQRAHRAQPAGYRGGCQSERKQAQLSASRAV